MSEAPAEARLRRALAKNWPGHGPAQWLVYCPDNKQVSHCYDLRETAEAVAEQKGMKCLALVPTLSDAEREAVEQSIDAANGMAAAEPWTADTLRKLLERLR